MASPKYRLNSNKKTFVEPSLLSHYSSSVCILAFVIANIHAHAPNETFTSCECLLLCGSFFSLEFNAVGCEWLNNNCILIDVCVFVRCSLEWNWASIISQNGKNADIIRSFVTFSGSIWIDTVRLDTMDGWEVILFNYKNSGITWIWYDDHCVFVHSGTAQ